MSAEHRQAVAVYVQTRTLAMRGLDLVRRIERERGVPRVVIADDHESQRLMLARLLDDEFEIIAVAADGREALLLVEEAHPDLLLLDHYMPTMSGVEATRVARDLFPNVAVVVMSVDPAVRTEALTAGAHEFITKSEGVAALERVLRRWWEDRPAVATTDSPPSRSAVLLRSEAPLNLRGPLERRDVPADFEIWHEDSFTEDYEASALTWQVRRFVAGSRPSTTSPTIESFAVDCVEDAVARRVFQRLVGWTGEKSTGQYHAAVKGLALWPHASEHEPPRPLELVAGDDARAFTGTTYGRRRVWSYVRAGRIVHRLDTTDVAVATALALMERQVELSTD